VVYPRDGLFVPEPDTREAKYTLHNFLTFTSKVRAAFPEEAYRGTADAVVACGPWAHAQVEAPAKVIRFSESPWETWLYPQYVAAGRKLGLPGHEALTPDAQRFVSDTRELTLDYGRGLLTIDTPRTKATIGFLAEAETIDLHGLEVRAQVPFAAVAATSLDGHPIGQSRRVLLTAVGRAENTGQAWWPPDEKQRTRSTMSWMLSSQGRPPVITEPIRGAIRVRMPGTAKVYALDPTGRRMAELSATTEVGTVVLDPAQAKSIWCEIVLQ
jgi:hypothetical protein